MHPASIFSFLFPRQTSVTHRERLISGAGGILAIFLTAMTAQHFIGGATLPFLLASMGASTVLLLGAPHSPLSQPWAFAGGHLISAFIGISCATVVPNVYLAAGLSVGLSISAMYYLRCLHPPGGATALLTVIGDQKIHALGYHFVFMPVLANVAILLTVALVINNLIPGRRYPANLSLPGKTDGVAAGGKPPVKLRFNEEDLRSAIREMGAYIDVSSEDLTRIYALATLHAHRSRLGDIRLKDIMTREVVTIRPSAAQETVWSLLRAHHIRGVPVTDDHGRVTGMVTIADFLKARDWRMCDSITQRVKLFLKRKSGAIAEQIMSTPVITAREDTHLTDAFLTFSEKGINHLPVADEEGRLVGIVTRLDLLAALYGDLAEKKAGI